MNNIVAFDLFETLVNRRVWPHNSVSWFLAEEIKKTHAVDFSSEEFIRQRQHAESITYRSLKAAYTLSKIYDNFAFDDLPEEVIHDLPSLERKMEIALAHPIEHNVRKFQAYQRAGKRVLIVTDTYLERDTIESIARKVGLTIDRENIFISNEHGHFKIKGKLFKAIGKAHGIQLIGSRHIGNSRGADVHGAMYAGIIPTFFREGNCNPLEAVLTASIDAPNLTMATLIGEIRNWRLGNADRPKPLSLMSTTIGFTALAYLSWIIRTCREKGIQRVYFLARDLYLLSEIVKLDAFSRHETNIEFRYLYGSRTTIDLIHTDESVHAYLEQEGVFDGVSSAVVDVGWGGSYHAKLHDYITQRNLPPVYGLFIGLESTQQTDLSQLRFSIFEQSEIPSKRLKNRFDANFLYLVEAIFRAPYASTIGYANVDGKIEPILEESSFDYTQLSTILSTSLQFVEKVIAIPEFHLDEPALEGALKKSLTRIALHPTSEEAMAYGSVQVESDADEALSQYCLSTPYTITDLGNILLRKQGLNNFRRQWTRGRIMSSNPLMRNIIGYLDKKF